MGTVVSQARTWRSESWHLVLSDTKWGHFHAVISRFRRHPTEDMYIQRELTQLERYGHLLSMQGKAKIGIAPSRL